MPTIWYSVRRARGLFVRYSFVSNVISLRVFIEIQKRDTSRTAARTFFSRRVRVKRGENRIRVQLVKVIPFSYFDSS